MLPVGEESDCLFYSNRSARMKPTVASLIGEDPRFRLKITDIGIWIHLREFQKHTSCLVPDFGAWRTGETPLVANLDSRGVAMVLVLGAIS